VVGAFDLDITTPTESDVQVDEGSGEITVENVNGKLTLNTGRGDIKVENIMARFRLPLRMAISRLQERSVLALD